MPLAVGQGRKRKVGGKGGGEFACVPVAYRAGDFRNGHFRFPQKVGGALHAMLPHMDGKGGAVARLEGALEGGGVGGGAAGERGDGDALVQISRYVIV